PPAATVPCGFPQGPPHHEPKATPKQSEGATFSRLFFARPSVSITFAITAKQQPNGNTHLGLTRLPAACKLPP
ncbi:MAG: hypothetical protein ACI3YD_00435, partial [Alloprevotella sp.]